MTHPSDVLIESTMPDLIYSGKVRDTHDAGNGLLLMVSTDRISAYDVVLPNAIPGKGAVLNQISAFWFAQTEHIVPNHLVQMGLDRATDLPESIKRRSMYVRKADRIDIECVARGYITGSALQEYSDAGTVAGLKIPSGMVEGDLFPSPIFTPATKAEEGHDENISVEHMADLIGAELTSKLQNITLKIYDFAHEFALNKGIIIADTKLEFGLIDGNITLIDELLTPDSSRFWDRDGYQPGSIQPNFDKQFVRDWLNSQKWNREPPAPDLPAEIVSKTAVRYEDAFVKITGRNLK
ncbi:MAG: phosphoribosylaminoimidazolesuccinocarboxamide synthase [SAR202 cluster bacterium]|nr:phosphoribosylaminoimidazolesuccinocarboxamide synthase [SAR202 cluster bacterium]HAE33437.1 phosphoribosylaminoimidazolesuccinocarboxamide synthase [Dehalococcoidia bacterium]|tara:strand:- start:1867 stop:2751 length:885 start_codon:yes stop_codon:yes gene_type:complete